MTAGFHPLADEEFRAAAAEYELAQEGLGEHFIAEVESMCAVLAEHPAYGKRLDDIHRQAPLKRFPFLVVYRISDTAIYVVAVAHKRRRPNYWRGRT